MGKHMRMGVHVCVYIGVSEIGKSTSPYVQGGQPKGSQKNIVGC